MCQKSHATNEQREADHQPTSKAVKEVVQENEGREKAATEKPCLTDEHMATKVDSTGKRMVL